MSELPPAERLTKLQTLEAWLDWQLRDTRRKIHSLQQVISNPAPRYVIEPKRNPTHPQPALIHLADCAMPQHKTLPVDADQARLGLASDPENVAACPFCAPDRGLGETGG